MKIKKVEIQAFRAYDRVENGTFDFKLGEEEYADFISLYAPNGFGKTSFYDAIEYSYTNNIDRLLKNKNNKDIAKSEKNISNNEKQYILRNRYSNPELDSFVKLHTNKADIVRNISNPRKGTSDFKFDEKETENKYFREVILSQDWISGFLKEDKPEDRYKTFIEYFGDKELDKYYNTLTALLSQNEKEIKKLNDQLKGIQLELKFDGDKDILSKVNEKIELLNKKIKLFNRIDSQTSETDIFDLTNSITERLSDIDFEVARHQDLILDLDGLIIGNEALIGFKQFKENSDNLKKLTEKQKELNLILAGFEDLKKKKNELASTQNHHLKLTKEKEQKEKILGLFSKYNDTIKRIKDKDEEIKILQLSQDALNKEISDQRIQISKLEIQISTNQNEIKHINQTVGKLPEIEQNILNSENQIKQLNKEASLKKDELEKKSKDIDLLEFFINDLSNSLLNIENGIFPSEFDKNFLKYSEQLRRSDELKKKIEEENKKLTSIKKEITEHDNFQAELDRFISKGLSIINDKKTDTCPLCNQEYKSYTDLADKVANNKLLSKTSNALLSRKNEIEKNVSSISEDIHETTILLVNSIKKTISENELKIQELKIQILNIKQSITDFETKVENESKRLADFRSSILNKPIEEYGEWVKEHLKKLSEEIKKYQSDLTSLKDKIKNNEEQSQISIKKTDLSNKDRESLKNNNIVNEVRTFFLENYPTHNVDSKYITDDLLNLTKTQKEYQTNFEILKTDIEKKEKNLVSANEDSIKQELEVLNSNISSLFRVIETYKIEVKKYIDLDIHIIEEDTFNEIINDIKESNKTKISDYRTEVKELNLLSQLKENVLPYLKFEENKKTHGDIKASKSLKDKINKKLKEEIANVSEHIEKQIKSFFYEDLINDLYKRIDPHPDYKKVKFIPDFKDNKPKLNVCVYKDNDDKNFIIPNLYFSQAQLNILSLCIFLAKALNAKDNKGNSIDCIFVDDPIQSMDSINILSTIDLLRSIVVNQQKQIILSTHDENFHNLLKKKIPSNLFKSKFMELETFGKVKQN
ncbi:AAA family ATPase [Dysgonomonas sp. HDW5B]|uniref:AAA family ATPase n=1 Tax=Dysgonomonas sp. HDW5B TaxID=2714927 RepID=UPI00140DEAAF|nr:AAA family ATPase [Dysgonomonas sp. HDW5B]QIK52875.1 AAA family ATPase [Dysgonomonas sp. HDW5B]